MSAGAAIVGAVAGAFALSACQSLDLDWMKGSEAEKPAAVVSDPAAVRLAEAATRAQEAVTQLAEERAAGVAPAVDIPRIVTPELQTRVTLDWLGPAENVAKRLADGIGYDFVVAGPRPSAPVMVEVAAKDEPVVFVLRDIGIQAKGRAHLTTDAQRRIVRLDWLGVESGPDAAAAADGDGS